MLALIGYCFQVPQKKIAETAMMMMLDKGQPYEEIARELVRDVQARVETVAHDHVDEDHQRHPRQQNNQENFQKAIEKIYKLLHRVLTPFPEDRDRPGCALER
jgi:hypothetical protein